MKIALLTEGVWPFEIGGMQKHSHYLIEYLSKENIHLTVFAPENLRGRLDKVYLNKSYIDFIFIKKKEIHYFPGHYLYSLYIYSKEIYKHLRNDLGQYDIIYIQGFAGWYLLKNIRSLELGPKTILNFHGLEMFQTAVDFKSLLQQLMFRPFVKFLLTRSHFVQSLGGALTGMLLKIGIESKSIIVMGNGIEEKWIKKSSLKANSIRTFAFVGRFEKRKGIIELIKSLKCIPNASLQFHFIGPIPENEKVLGDKFIYHGEIKDHKVIFKILDETDVLVCPSYSEGMPTVILEAMARGNAILATNVGANAELVDSSNGKIINRLQPRYLAEDLMYFIKMSDSDILKLKMESVKKVRKFSWEILIKTMINNFEKVKS